MTKFNDVTATVAKTGLKFAFFSVVHNGEKMDVIVYPDTVRAAGFKAPFDLNTGDAHQIDYVEAKDGRLTVRKLHVAQSDGATTPVEPGPITLDVFFKSTKIDCNKETGECIWKITNKSGEFVQYVVAIDDRVVVRQLGNITLTDARADIKKVINHPVVEGAKTNDPALSQSMQGASAGGKKAA